MKKLFGKLILVLSLALCFSSAFAEKVLYSLENGEGQSLGRIEFDYRSSAGGYETVMNGEKISLEIVGTTAIGTMGDLIVTTTLPDSSYYHNKIRQWRISPFTTSSGDAGIAKMLYVGITPIGKRYREEVWLNGNLIITSEAIVDNNNRIVLQEIVDSEGSLRMKRL